MKRESDNEKLMRGTLRKDRIQNATPIGIPVKNTQQYLEISGYDNLSRRAKAIYRRKCHEMVERGALYLEDLTQLILYAHSVDSFWLFDAEVKKYGAVVEEVSREGNSRLVPNPAVRMRNEALKNILSISANFGFSPKDRQSLKFNPNDDSDPLTSFLRQYGADNQ